MKEQFVKGIKSILLFVVIVAVVVAIVMAFFSVIPIKGTSMMPTIKDADNVLVIKHTSIERGDIVVFEDEEDDSRLIKRVIALAGDVVELKEDVDGELAFFVNGDRLKEDYLNQDTATASQHIAHKATVPEGCFYYLGDNRLVSKDSSSLDEKGVPHFGKTSTIIGKVVFRYNVVDSWEFEGIN